MFIYKLPLEERELFELEAVLRERQDSKQRKLTIADILKKTELLLEVAIAERRSVEAREAFDNLVGYSSIDDDIYYPELDDEDETSAEDV